jgi:hypothetical protein
VGRVAPLPGFDRLCYNGAAVEQGGKPISAYEATEEQVLRDKRVVQEPQSDPSGFGAVPAGLIHHEDASRFCPVCSQRLESRRCKLVCTFCGYYMSCADYY